MRTDGTLLTIEDMLTLNHQVHLNRCDRFWELHEGRLVWMKPGGMRRSTAITHIMFRLGQGWFQSRQSGDRSRNVGMALGRCGIIVGRNPDTVLAPCTSYISPESIPLLDQDEHWLTHVPEIVVEVVNHVPDKEQLLEKKDWYLSAGGNTVWIADPHNRTVEIHQHGQAIMTVGGDDTLTTEFIPSFAMTMSAIFDD